MTLDDQTKRRDEVLITSFNFSSRQVQSVDANQAMGTQHLLSYQDQTVGADQVESIGYRLEVIGIRALYE